MPDCQVAKRLRFPADSCLVFDFFYARLGITFQPSRDSKELLGYFGNDSFDILPPPGQYQVDYVFVDVNVIMADDISKPDHFFNYFQILPDYESFIGQNLMVL